MYSRTIILFVLICTYSLFSSVPSKVYFDSSTKKYGFSDSDNRIVIPPIYDNVWPFDATYTKAKVVLDGSIGFINPKGEFKLDKLVPFKGEKAMWGYSDSEGELAITPIFYWVSEFIDGISVVQTYYKKGRDWLPNIPNTYKCADEEHFRFMDLKGKYLGKIYFSKIDLNDPVIQEEIGDVFKNGYYILNDKKVEYLKNNQFAKNWYLKSMKKKSENPEIYFKLGQVTEDKERDSWFIEAAKRGHIKAIEYLESQYIWISDSLSEKIKKENSEIAEVNAELQRNGVNEFKFIHKSLVKNINVNLVNALNKITNINYIYCDMLSDLANVFAEKKGSRIISDVRVWLQQEMFPIVKGFDVSIEYNEDKTMFSIIYKKRNEDFCVYLAVFNSIDSKNGIDYIVFTNKDQKPYKFLQALKTNDLNLIRYVSGKIYPVVTSEIRESISGSLVSYLRKDYRKNVVRYLVEEMGADIKGSDLDSSLYAISECSNFNINENELVDTVTYLIKNGARVDAENKYQRKPIYAALTKKNTKLISTLIDAGGCNSNDPIEYLNSYIADFHDLSIIKLYVEKCKIDVNRKDSENGNNPLHYVARLKGNAETDAVGVAEYLIKKGANVNITNKNGKTPLHELVNRAGTDFSNVTIMLASTFHDSGANFNLKDAQGNTPLNIIEKRNDQNMDYYFNYILKYFQKNTLKK